MLRMYWKPSVDFSSGPTMSIYKQEPVLFGIGKGGSTLVLRGKLSRDALPLLWVQLVSLFGDSGSSSRRGVHADPKRNSPQRTERVGLVGNRLSGALPVQREEGTFQLRVLCHEWILILCPRRFPKVL
ncbi:unnamed protein product, partial [Cyprideis torosa]